MVDDNDSLLKLLFKRGDVLHGICGNETDKKAIQAQLGISRPTVDRAFRELGEAGVLKTVGTSHELTLFGLLSCQVNRHLEQLSKALVASERIFPYHTPDIPIDFRLMYHADYIYPDDFAPQQKFLELIKT